jgi:hypothetical protein
LKLHNQMTNFFISTLPESSNDHPPPPAADRCRL